MFQAQVASLAFAEVAIFCAHCGRERGFVFSEFFADVFEAGERLHAAKAVFFCDGFLQVGGDERLDDRRMLRVCGREHTLLDQFTHAIRGDE